MACAYLFVMTMHRVTSLGTVRHWPSSVCRTSGPSEGTSAGPTTPVVTCEVTASMGKQGFHDEQFDVSLLSFANLALFSPLKKRNKGTVSSGQCPFDSVLLRVYNRLLAAGGRRNPADGESCSRGD